MKRLPLTSILSSLTMLIAIPGMAEDSADHTALKAAVKALSDRPNYNWVATYKEGAGRRSRTGPNDGWTEKGGWTHYITRFGDNLIESVFHGKKAAIGRDGEWQTLADIEGSDSPWRARMLQGFKTPAVEAAEIVAKITDVKKGEDNVYVGALSAEVAKGMLASRGRRGGSGPANAKGSVKFWVKDGVIVQFETNVRGTVPGRDGGEREVDRTTTIEIKGIGKTKVTVPDEAKKLLS